MFKHTGILTIVLISVMASPRDSISATFDRATLSPRTDATDIRQRIEKYFSLYKEKRLVDVGALVRDPTIQKKWLDMKWSLLQALDQKKDIGDLVAFGLTKTEDGYRIDLDKFPEWRSPILHFSTLADSQTIDGIEADLKARGFRDKDISILREYISKSNLKKLEFDEKKELFDSFSLRIKTKRRANSGISTEEMLSFMYQEAKVLSDTQQSWCVDLLDSLDLLRQQILLSYFEEYTGGTSFINTSRAGVKSIEEHAQEALKFFSSGEYELTIKQLENTLEEKYGR